MANEKARTGGAFVGGTAVGLGVGLALGRPAKAEAVEPAPPKDVTEALARLDQTLKAINTTLLSVDAALVGLSGQQSKIAAMLENLSSALTALYPAAAEARIIEPFKKESQTLTKNVPLTLNQKAGRGGLIWALVDVSDSNTKLSIKLDKLVWEFTLSTLLSQGVDKPTFPGVWLSRADPGPPAHYCLVFSAGTLAGFTYSTQFHLYVTFMGTGTATLHEGRGIRWEPA